MNIMYANLDIDPESPVSAAKYKEAILNHLNLGI